MIRHLSSASTDDLLDMLAEAERAVVTTDGSPPDRSVRQHEHTWLSLRSLIQRELERREADHPAHHRVPRLPPPTRKAIT